MNFEAWHWIIRYVSYLTISTLIIWIFSNLNNPTGNHEYQLFSTETRLLITALFTTILSLMDLSWHASEKKDGETSFSIAQASGFTIGFFIFGATAVLINWISNLL